MYETKQARTALAKQLALEGIVLLQNDGILPVDSPKKLAVFGKACVAAQTGGAGSGASRGGSTVSFDQAAGAAGLSCTEASLSFYRACQASRPQRGMLGPMEGEEGESKSPEEMMKSLQGLVASGMIYELFGRYSGPEEEPELPEALLQAVRTETDTALLFLDRTAGGEECDRRVEDYHLLESEQRLIRTVTAAFPSVILVVNEVSPIDLGWIRDYPQIRAVMSMGAAGEQQMPALVDLLLGLESPSGKLGQTMVLRYEDHPSAPYIRTNKDKPEELLCYENFGLSAQENGSIGFEKSLATVYGEDIYVGYRYFDTYEVPVLFPFGYGLSYTAFGMDCGELQYAERKMLLPVRVRNTGSRFAGKEVVQVYLSAPSGQLNQPYQKLVGFAKTEKLECGEAQELEIEIPLDDMASYDMAAAAYVLEPGVYQLRLGNSSRNTMVAAQFEVAERIVTEQLSNRLSMKACNADKLQLLNRAALHPACEMAVAFTLRQADVEIVRHEMPVRKPVKPAVGATLADVKSGKVTLQAFVAQMTDEELAVLCNGYGPGLPFGGMGAQAAPTIQDTEGNPIATNTHPSGSMGYVSPAIEKYGIRSASYKDGPTGVGQTAWPTELVLARSWNTALLHDFGVAAGHECETESVDSWLAPAMNLQRALLCGRNFEYFSEDPFLSGNLAAAEVVGVAETGRTTCPKHFACNEQETYRRGSAKKRFDAADSIMTERAARELYLKPFEKAVKTGAVHSIMTSFNKINGVFAGGSYDLCTAILRGEWGFDGVVVTDWGDMDIVVDGADAVRAGNDVVMPGGPPVIAQVLAGLQDGRVNREEMCTAVEHLLRFVMNAPSCQ